MSDTDRLTLETIDLKEIRRIKYQMPHIITYISIFINNYEYNY